MGRGASPVKCLRGAVIGAVAVLVAGLAACSSGSTSSGAGPAHGPVEKTRIRVGVLPVVDVGPYYLAVENGYFKAEGLDVETVVTQSGKASIDGLISGELDISQGSYPAAFQAQSRKAADFKIVAEALAAKPGHLVLGAPPNSPVKRMQDVAGKRVAVTAKNTMCDLAPKAVLESNSVDYTKIQWVEMSFPEMIPAMQRGDVDAACLVEPWVTTAAKQIGAVPLVDGASGPTANMPMAGFVVNSGQGRFGSTNPNTIAAFQRALNRAALEAQDRSKVEPVLIKYVKIDQETADIMTIATYSTSLDARRVQRVADLMEHFGVIKEHLDVSKMIWSYNSKG